MHDEGTKKNVCMMMVIPSNPKTCTQKNLVACSKQNAIMQTQVSNIIVGLYFQSRVILGDTVGTSYYNSLCAGHFKEDILLWKPCRLYYACLHNQGKHYTFRLLVISANQRLGKARMHYSGEGVYSIDTWEIQGSLAIFHALPTSQTLFWKQFTGNGCQSLWHGCSFNLP